MSVVQDEHASVVESRIRVEYMAVDADGDGFPCLVLRLVGWIPCFHAIDEQYVRNPILVELCCRLPRQLPRGAEVGDTFAVFAAPVLADQSSDKSFTRPGRQLNCYV
ncbi:hypothetical protein OG368_36255 [Streptomyces sp. NBC_01124]|nr:hypothetical protein OG368_00680 [Streptomyces sp. NBC_01124]WSU05771.1 hypothetical protein OG368_36255 [Streptomyces sp. NBC_01124]